MPRPDAVVVGSGVIGLAIARALRGTGRTVTIVDPHPGSGASAVAAGMLAPVTEASYGEEAIAELAVRSVRSWPRFAESIEASSGLSVAFERCGTLLVAAESQDAADLEALYGFHRQLGLDSNWLSGSSARRSEPLLATNVRAALHARDDGQVDSRRLLAALALDAERIGVELIRSEAREIVSVDNRVEGVVVEGEMLAAPLVVLAAGYATGLLPGLPAAARPPVRPVKGQIARLRVRSDTPSLRQVVRGIVAGNNVYVVPRGDGQVIVGATVEDQGADRTLTAGALYGLLRDAIRILPVVSEYELTEFSAALRPGSLDNAAIVGSVGVDGLVLACGHYRNGILFAPVTVDAAMGLIEEGALPDWAWPIDAERLRVRSTGASL